MIAIQFPDEDVLAVRRQNARLLAEALHRQGFPMPLVIASRLLYVKWSLKVGLLVGDTEAWA